MYTWAGTGEEDRLVIGLRESNRKRGRCILDTEFMKQQVKEDCMMLPRGTLFAIARDMHRADFLRTGASLLSHLRSRGDASLLCRAVTHAYFSAPIVQLHALEAKQLAGQNSRKRRTAGETSEEEEREKCDTERDWRLALAAQLQSLREKRWGSLEPWEKLIRILH
nr:TPA: hypothetical protein BN1205_012940 [Toxoplasma gondii VEG]